MPTEYPPLPAPQRASLQRDAALLKEKISIAERIIVGCPAGTDVDSIEAQLSRYRDELSRATSLLAR